MRVKDRRYALRRPIQRTGFGLKGNLLAMRSSDADPLDASRLPRGEMPTEQRMLGVINSLGFQFDERW